MILYKYSPVHTLFFGIGLTTRLDRSDFRSAYWYTLFAWLPIIRLACELIIEFSSWIWKNRFVWEWGLNWLQWNRRLWNPFFSVYMYKWVFTIRILWNFWVKLLKPLRGGCHSWRWNILFFYMHASLKCLEHVGERIFSYLKYFRIYSRLSGTVRWLKNRYLRRSERRKTCPTMRKRPESRKLIFRSSKISSSRKKKGPCMVLE